MAIKSAWSLLALASVVLATKYQQQEQCAVQFDGRLPAGSTPAAFDKADGIYDPDYVKGKGLKWSDIIKIPRVPPSLFDNDGRSKTIPFEVTIDDRSIFAPSDDNVQAGFRRAELLHSSNGGEDASTIGIKTLHFSVRKDNSRPLNISHEYQLVFLESADYSTNQVVLKTGKIIDFPTRNPDSLMVFGNVKSPNLLWTTPFTPNVWHNFGLILNFASNTTQVTYSKDGAPLRPVTGSLSNDISGQGQYHFGLLKKPTGKFSDMTKEGYQPKRINEGIIYGGIFQEDTISGCASQS